MEDNILIPKSKAQIDALIDQITAQFAEDCKKFSDQHLKDTEEEYVKARTELFKKHPQLAEAWNEYQMLERLYGSGK